MYGAHTDRPRACASNPLSRRPVLRGNFRPSCAPDLRRIASMRRRQPRSPMTSHIPRDIVRLCRNFLLSLGGEGLQSGIHFVLNLVLIRILSPHDFGIFAIAFVLGGISLTYGNALVSTPAAVLIPRLKSRREADFQEVVFGSIALVISAGITIIVAAGLWLATGQVVEAIAGGTFSGLWTLRNHVRCVMFARHAIPAATLSDFSYSATGVVLI